MTTAESASDRARLLLSRFQAAVAQEDRAREAVRQHPGQADLITQWIQAMDATHEASKALREGTREL